MLVVLRNPHAGRGKKDPGAAIRAVIAGRGRLVETDDLAALDAAAPELLAAKRLAVWGGDGTVTALLTALYRAAPEARWPELAILPAGTINAVAQNLGGWGTPQEVLTRLLSTSGQVRLRRTVMEVGGRCGFLFGIGLIPNYVEAYKRARRRGPVAALATMARAAAFPGHFFRPFTAELFDGEERFAAGRFTNLSAGTVERLPFGFRAYPRATERPKSFHFVAHDLSAAGALAELPRLRTVGGMKRVREGVFEALRIELDAAMPFSFDGDVFEPRRSLELRALRTVRLLVP